MHSLLGKHWHHLPTDEVLDLLDTNIQQGLDVFEVKHRQERFGLNLLTSRDLQVTEAALTGESLPVVKDADLTVPHDAILAERRNMAYASTLVTYGAAIVVVVATGNGSEVGRISQLIANAAELETPLTRKIGQFSRVLLVAILVLSALTFGIGVAMGITGTDVSKEAADIFLTDDNFASIEAAIEEGRGVFDNLTKFIAWTLPTNLGEGLVLLAAIVTGATLPILPIQLLWINMVSAAILGVALSLEPKEPGIMQRKPRNPQALILTGTLLWRIVLVSVIILAGAIGLFEVELSRGALLAEARTVAVNVVIFVEIFCLFNARSLTRSPFQLGFFSNPWAVGAAILMALIQLLYTYAPFMNTHFGSAPMSLVLWLDVLAVGLAAYVIIEVEKWLRRKFGR